MPATTLSVAYLWSGVIIAATACAPFVWKGLKLFLAFCRALANAVHTTSNELTPNGGGSVKDAVNKLLAGQEEMRLWMANHDGLHRGAWGD